MKERDITLWHWEYYLSRNFPFLHKKKVFTTYRGSGTVWHNLETGKRCHTFLEGQLCDLNWLKEQKEK